MIEYIGKPQKRNSLLRDKPNDMSLTGWIKLCEKLRLKKAHS